MALDTSSPVCCEELKNSFSGSEEVAPEEKSKLRRAFESRDLELAKELTKKVKNLNIIYEAEYRNGQKGNAQVLLRYFVEEACKDDSWFKFYQDVLSEQDGKIDIDDDISLDGTALSYACRGKNIDVAKLLLEYKANVNKVNRSREKAPIYFALKNNDDELASLLFEHRAKIDITPELEQAIIANSYSEKNKYTKKTMEVLLQHTSPKQNTKMLRRFSDNNTSTDEDIEIVELLLDKGADPNIGEPNAMQIATNKNNTRLIDLFSPRQVSEADNLISAKVTDILNNEEMDQEKAEVSGRCHSESQLMGMDAHNNLEDASSCVQNYPTQSSIIDSSNLCSHLEFEHQSMGTHNSFEDGGNRVQNDLLSFMYRNPNLYLKFIGEFGNFIDTKRNNPDQSSSLSESYASWCTNWSLEDSITENDSFSSYQEEYPREHIQKGVANFPRLDNVHSILSRKQQQLFNCSNNPFSMSCLSIQEQESLQASLESNSASIQQSLQLKKRPLYDVNKKVFNSIDYQMNTEFSEHERSEQGFLVPNKSLSNNSLEKEVKSNWVFQSSEVIQPKTQSQDLNDKDAKFSNNNSALVSSFGQANKEEDLRQARQEIDNLKSKVLTQELQQEKELKKTNTQLTESKNLANAYNYQLSEYKEELERIEAQLKEKEQTQVGLESSIFQQRQEIADLTNQVAQLIQKEQELDDTKQDLATKTSETNIKNDTISAQQASINNLTIEKSQLENILKNTKEKFAEELKEIKDQLAKKEKKLDVAKENVLQLEGGLKQANQKIDDLTRENNQLTKKKDLSLSSENKKLSAVSAQSRKQVTYASVSFVLSGAFAVGASLTIPYLAICITLAVAASIFLATGFYCSYKANTALSNVEIDQIENGVDHVAA